MIEMNGQTGLTLVELMVTLAVAIVLLAVGVPLYQGMVANNAVVAQTTGLVTALSLARSEAVKRGATVAVCPKATADVSDTDCGGNTDWANGWHLFTDDSGTVGDFDGSDEILRHWGPLSGSAVVDTTAGFVRFGSDGFSTTAADQSLELIQAEASAAAPRCIRVSVNGQVQLQKASCP